MSTEPVKVVITAEFQQLITALNSSTKQLQEFGNKVKAQNKSMGDGFSKLKGQVLGFLSVYGAVSFLKGTVEQTKNWTVEANKLSKVLGITTEEASVLNLAVGDIYGNMDEFLPLAAKLTKTLNTDEAAFQRLGVSTRDANGHLRPTMQIMQDTNAALLKVKGGTDRNIEANRIYGKSWMEVTKYLNLTGDVISAAEEKAKKLHLIVGPEGAEKVAEYRASVNDFEDTVMALKIGIGEQLMPELVKFNNWASNEGPQALSGIGTAVKGLSGVFQGLKFLIGTIVVWFAGLAMSTLALWTGVAETIRKKLSFDFSGAEEASKRASDTIRNEMGATIDEIKEKWADLGDSVSGIQGQRHAVNNAAIVALTSAPNGGKPAGSGKPKENVFAEELTKLTKERAGIAENLTESAKQEAAWKKLQAEQDERIAKFQAQLKAEKLNPDQAKKLAEESNALLASQQEKFLQENEKASDEFYAELYAIRQEREEKHAIALLDIDKSSIERRRDLGQISAMEALVLLKENEEKKFQVEKTALEKRLALYQLDPEKNAKLVSKNISEQQALTDKQNASRQGFNFQRADVALQSNGPAGGLNALQSLLEKSKNKFEQWRDTVTEIFGSVQNAFGNSINAMITGQMTPLEALKSLWSDLGKTVAQAISKIIAQKITEWVIDKAIAAWRSMTAKTEVVESGVVTQANIGEAASKTFKAHASFPWVGIAVAIAMIALMMSTMKSIKGRAVGGLVSHPELTLLGERGPEVVAPEHDFNDWAGNLTRNILAQERRVRNYNMQGSRYAKAASAAAGSQGMQQVFPGATIITMDHRQWQEAVAMGQRGYERRYA